ncbi:hypothetical protein PsB1_0919 [Candidatus Phycosocius spiralis]|uniref:Secreted protein n=1 Tax=Candidatus Phycosocius spiralis TaxID=2815099 RepID=A0ABQ4PUR5_9PROT|nr:hypothetical protein PsB1_0919 [Candidatus Phycosocius spiralis]
MQAANNQGIVIAILLSSLIRPCAFRFATPLGSDRAACFAFSAAERSAASLALTSAFEGFPAGTSGIGGFAHHFVPHAEQRVVRPVGGTALSATLYLALQVGHMSCM